MVTKQHSQLMNIVLKQSSLTSGYIKRYDGSTGVGYNPSYINICAAYNSFNTSGTLYWNEDNNIQYGYMIVGSGSTSPTEDDYCLESTYSTSQVIEFSKYVSANTVNEYTRQYRIYTSSINNLTEENIVVREVGLLIKVMGNQYLVTRDVLDNPVIIPPKGIKSFSIKLNL